MVEKGLFSMEIEARNFNKHIKQFKKQVNIVDEIVLKKFAFDLIKKIIEKSPVDTGRSINTSILNYILYVRFNLGKFSVS